MENDPIVYNQEEKDIVINRHAAPEGGLVGFLLKRKIVATAQQAKIVLVVVAVVCIVLAAIIPFIW